MMPVDGSFEIPLEALARSGLRFTIDTNVIVGRSDPDVQGLYRLHRNGWINLEKTDTLDTERTVGAPPALAARRLAESEELVEVLGPLRWDHSRWDHAVFGSSDDEDRDDEIFELVWDHPRTATSTARDLRDAFHISTSIRYGFDGFITKERALVAASPEINARHPTFRVLDPPSALAMSRARIATIERVEAAKRAIDFNTCG